MGRCEIRHVESGVISGTNANLGSVLVFTHHWDEAIAQSRTSNDLDPNYGFDYYFLGRAATRTLENGGARPSAYTPRCI
jgi:hypothetical protein